MKWQLSDENYILFLLRLADEPVYKPKLDKLINDPDPFKDES